MDIQKIIPDVLHLNGNIFSFKHQSFKTKEYEKLVNDILEFHKSKKYKDIKLNNDYEIILSHNFKNIKNDTKICKKCKQKQRSRMLKILQSKVICRKCGCKSMRPKRKAK